MLKVKKRCKKKKQKQKFNILVNSQSLIIYARNSMILEIFELERVKRFGNAILVHVAIIKQKYKFQ